MAADWFPMCYYRARCSEVVAIAAATGRSQYEVLGILCEFWSWASSESVDGHIRGVRLHHLPGAVCADLAFWRAVAAVNWLAEDDHGIVVPGWDNWLSESAKKRARAAIKKRIQRRRRPDSVPKVSPPGGDQSGDYRRQKTEDRKEKKENPPTPLRGRERARNPLFDALAEVSGLDPATAGKRIGTAAALLAKADPPYSPDEVREFGRLFWKLCPWAADSNRARPTPHEVANHIGLLRAPDVARTARPHRMSQKTEYAASTLIDALGLNDDYPTEDPPCPPRVTEALPPGPSPTV